MRGKAFDNQLYAEAMTAGVGLFVRAGMDLMKDDEDFEDVFIIVMENIQEFIFQEIHATLAGRGYITDTYAELMQEINDLYDERHGE